MTRMLATRVFDMVQGPGGDNVICGLWLPAGTILNGINGYIHVNGTILTDGKFAMGAIEAWVLRVDDPDGAELMQTLWDRRVPKDSSANTMDLDAGTADTQSFYEPGEISWEEVFDIGAQPQRLFHRHWISAFGLNNIMVNQDPETPFDFQFMPGKTVPVQVRARSRVAEPSLVVFGLASPSGDATSVSEAIAAAAESDWGQMRYIDHVLERAQLSLLGLTEAGAETPWDEASTLLRKHLRPKVLEITAGNFTAVSWLGTGEMRFDVSVEGTMKNRTIDLGRG